MGSALAQTRGTTQEGVVLLDEDVGRGQAWPPAAYEEGGGLRVVPRETSIGFADHDLSLLSVASSNTTATAAAIALVFVHLRS